MKLKLIEYVVGKHSAYKVDQISPCCDEILRCGLIELNADCHWEYGYSPLVGIEWKTDDYDYDMRETNYTRIKFCPFCSAKIEIEVVKKIDATSEYEKLEEQENQLRRESKKTDSKTEEKNLLNEAFKISRIVNGYFETDSIKLFLKPVDKYKIL